MIHEDAGMKATCHISVVQCCEFYVHSAVAQAIPYNKSPSGGLVGEVSMGGYGAVLVELRSGPPCGSACYPTWGEVGGEGRTERVEYGVGYPTASLGHSPLTHVEGEVGRQGEAKAVAAAYDLHVTPSMR